MIPKIIHFIFGLDEKFCNKPFCLFHKIAILSAKKLNPTYTIILHYKFEPENNEYWEFVKKEIFLDKIDVLSDDIFGKKVIYKEHISDILRLTYLTSIGGIYLDIDTICVKPFDDLLDNRFVIGIESFKGIISGLCNAVIMSEPNSEFSNIWMKEYINFDPHNWNEMSVQKPYELSKLHPNLVSIQPQCHFFKYDWHSIIDVFNDDGNLNGCYCIHLWETKTYHPILKHITEHDIKTRNCIYNILARPIV